MAIFSFTELVHLVIMTAAIGYILTGYIRNPSTINNILTPKTSFNWQDFKFAVLVAAPGIILHELGHKFVGIAMGVSAVFSMSPLGLFLGVFLRWISSPFIIFAPGYVSLSGALTQTQVFFTAFAGPFMNLLLFLVAYLILDRKKNLTRVQAVALHLTKQINLFLFLFNLIPFPPFDGYKVFTSLFGIIF